MLLSMNTVSSPVCRARTNRKPPECFQNRTGFPGRQPSEDKPALPALAEVPPRRWKQRILLIDDDEQVLASVALALESEGYDVILAGDGFEATMKCQHYRPQLVLVDLNMPRFDGWRTLEVIERLQPMLPMIVITAQPLQYERAVAFGVDALMEKPLDFPVLLAAIEKLLSEPPHERLARITAAGFATQRLGSVRDHQA